MGSPTEDFDGSAEVEFVAEGLSPLFASSSTSTGQKEWASGSSSSDGSSSILSSDARHPLTSSGRGDGLPLSPYEGGTKVSAADGKTRDGIASFDGVIYYHCPSGNYWNGSQTSDTTGADSESWEESSSGSCELCTEIAEGNIEVVTNLLIPIEFEKLRRTCGGLLCAFGLVFRRWTVMLPPY